MQPPRQRRSHGTASGTDREQLQPEPLAATAVAARAAAGPSTVRPPSPARRAIHCAATFCRKHPEPRQEAQPHPDSDDLDEHAKICRICFESGADGDGVLYRPCECRGTMAWVHVECLSKWRRVSANPRSFLYCDQCNCEYQLSGQCYSTAAFWMACGAAVQQFGVWALYSDLALPCYLLGGALMLLGALRFDRSPGHPNEWNAPPQSSTVIAFALVLVWAVIFILAAGGHLGGLPDGPLLMDMETVVVFAFLIWIATPIAAGAIACDGDGHDVELPAQLHATQLSRNEFWLMICLHAILVGLQVRHTTSECPLYYRPTTPSQVFEAAPPPMPAELAVEPEGAAGGGKGTATPPSRPPSPSPPPPPPPPRSRWPLEYTGGDWNARAEYTRSMTYEPYESGSVDSALAQAVNHDGPPSPPAPPGPMEDGVNGACKMVPFTQSKQWICHCDEGSRPWNGSAPPPWWIRGGRECTLAPWSRRTATEDKPWRLTFRDFRDFTYYGDCGDMTLGDAFGGFCHKALVTWGNKDYCLPTNTGILLVGFLFVFLPVVVFYCWALDSLVKLLASERHVGRWIQFWRTLASFC